MQSLLPFSTINSLKVKILSEEDIKETSELLNKQFIQRNPLWINSKIDKNESLHIVKQRVRRGLEDSLSMSLLVDGKQIMAVIHVDLKKYLSGNFKIEQIYPWQQVLQQVNKHLCQKYFQKKNIEQGQYIFGDLIASISDHDKAISVTNFWTYCILMHKAQGYKGFFAHTTNPASLKFLCNLGGKSLLTETIYTDNNIKNRIDLVFVDFQKLKGMIPKL